MQVEKHQGPLRVNFSWTNLSCKPLQGLGKLAKCHIDQKSKLAACLVYEGLYIAFWQFGFGCDWFKFIPQNCSSFSTPSWWRRHLKWLCSFIRIIFLCQLLEIFAHFSNILPSWGPNCPDGTSFCPLSSSGKVKGCFGRGCGCFVYVHIPERCVWQLSKEQGLGVVFWTRWDPIWAKWDPFGQFVRKVGKRALGLGERNSIFSSIGIWADPLFLARSFLDLLLCTECYSAQADLCRCLTLPRDLYEWSKDWGIIELLWLLLCSVICCCPCLEKKIQMKVGATSLLP